MIEIKNRFTGEIIISGKYESIKDCLEKNNGANLWEANLREANLRGANLREADLREANLREANLWEADLRGANLRGANLREADLRGANLREANLREANLNISHMLISNSVQTILTIINWGELSDKLTLEMMRHDAESCGIDAMTAWVEGGGCPFSNSVRDYQFQEKRELWIPGKPKLRGMKLLKALCKEKGYALEEE